MPLIHNRLRTLALTLLFLIVSSFLIFHIASMWQKGLTSSRDGSDSLGAFAKASDFLSQNLGQDEIAIVPMRDVFYVLNPKLSGRLVDYESIWKETGVLLQANTTKEETLKVRLFLINYLASNSRVKFVVKDWVDSYATPIYEGIGSEELMTLLNEVQMFPFTLSTGWSSEITVYERVNYAPLLSMSLSFPPEQYFVVPSNSSIQFDLNGATLQKTGPNVNFYLPLLGGINASRQNYLTLGVKFDVENVDLTIIFYYDKNRDSRFSYDVDYVKSVVLNKVQQGWTEGKSYVIAQVIPKAEDPVVVVGLFLSGDSNGSVTFSSLNIYKAVT